MGRRPISADEAVARIRDAGFEPIDPYPGSVLAKWRCWHLCGAECSPTLNNARSAKPCRSCGGRSLVSADDAVALMRERGLEPLEPFPGRTEPWRCRCIAAGHEVSVKFWQRTNTRGCPTCGPARKAASQARNDAPAAEGLIRAKGLVVIEPYPGSSAPWRVACGRCGEHMTVIVANMRFAGATGRCPSCFRNELVARDTEWCERYGWTVLDVPVRVSEPWTLRHRCGVVHRFEPGSVQTVSGGCPECATHGYSKLRPGYLYLLRLPEHDAMKIGITNVLDRRLAQHRLNFEHEVIQVWGPLPGHLPPLVEGRVKAYWGKTESLPALEGCNGHTEITSLATHSIDDVISLVEEVLAERSVFDPIGFEIRPVDPAAARELLESGHYAGGMPIGMSVTLGLFEQDQLRGVAAFGQPSYPGVGKKLWPKAPVGGIAELRRFYVEDSLGHNAESWFLASALRALKREIEMVLAFSDPGVGHQGTIYRAANFVYLGTTSPSYHYEAPDGRYVHKRVPWNRAKAADPGRHPVAETEMAEAMGLVRVEDEGKHRYGYGRTRRTRAILKAAAAPN